MVGYFNRPGPEVAYSYQEIGLEVTFELHCRTANPTCPVLLISRYRVRQQIPDSQNINSKKTFKTQV